MQTLTLRLMNHHFEVPCELEEHEKLEQAAMMLNDKLNSVSHLKGEHKVLMVALNICYDYLQMKHDTLAQIQDLETQIDQLIDEANQAPLALSHSEAGSA